MFHCEICLKGLGGWFMHDEKMFMCHECYKRRQAEKRVLYEQEGE